MESVRATVAQLPYLDKSTLVRPGSTWQGFLVFKMDIHDLQDQQAYLQKVDKLTFKIANVMVNGAPVELVSTRFDRTSAKMTMICPGNAPPSMKRCKPQMGEELQVGRQHPG